MSEFSPKQIEMIGKACRKAGVPYPDFDQTKEWMLGLAEVAEEVTDERGQSARDYDMEHNINSQRHRPSEAGLSDHEIADSEVPYLTYKLWLIWTDLALYREWDEMEYRESVDHSNIERMPQIACYEVALNVIQNW
tara:strand:- start:177 stop:584 length:408 start_codon:yes stop_codon:yes gene_type:complete